MEYRRPGVYHTHRIAYAPLTGRMEPAVPAILGYTERARDAKGSNLHLVPTLIQRWEDFVAMYGNRHLKVAVGYTPGGNIVDMRVELTFHTHESVRLYFENGGRDIMVVSIGNYATLPVASDFLAGIKALETEDLPGLVLMPDSVGLSLVDQGFVQGQLLAHCASLRHRFALLDLIELGSPEPTVDSFRAHLQGERRDLGAAYYPWVHTALSIRADQISYYPLVYKADPIGKALTDVGVPMEKGVGLAGTNSSKGIPVEPKVPPEVVAAAQLRLSGLQAWMPPSGAVAGLIVRTDRNRGSFKAPANDALKAVVELRHRLNIPQQEDMNVCESGLSVNALLVMPGRGVVVNGARTLDSNSREWRYVPVRRYFLAVEKVLRDHMQQFVFDNNDAVLWHRLRAVLQGYLREQWRMGALLGASEEEAYHIAVGLHETMRPEDVLEGRLIVEVGLAVARPAEFIVMQFVHHLESDRTSISIESN